MRLLAFGDLMGRSELVDSAFHSWGLHHDVVVFTGDIPNPEVFKLLREKAVASGEVNPETVKDAIETDERVERVRREVMSVRDALARISQVCPVIGVFGNADLQKLVAPLSWGSAMTALHRTSRTLNKWIFVGYNGRPLYGFEKENDDENAFREEQAF